MTARSAQMPHAPATARSREQDRERARARVRDRNHGRAEMIRTRGRQVALLGAMLLSGGMLSIPRIPLLVLVLVACFALKNPQRMLKVEFAPVWLLLALTTAVALVGGDTLQLEPLAVRFANFLAAIAMLALYIDERPDLISKDLLPILRFFSIQAILTPVLALVVPGIFWSFNVGETVYETFLYVFTYHDFIEGAYRFKRADGFFFEPGVFQIYLNIYLFIALFVKRFSVVDIGLATVAVIATQSSTGAIILVIQYGYVYLRWLRTAGRMQKLGLFILAPVVLLPIATYTVYNLTEKVQGANWGSAEARSYDLRTGINVTLEHPLTGIGFDYEKYFAVSADVGYREAQLSNRILDERPNTNGIVTIFYSVGIPLALVFMFALFRQRMFRPRLLFGAVIFISMLGEALLLKPFFLMIIFSGVLVSRRVLEGGGVLRRAKLGARSSSDLQPQARLRPDLQLSRTPN